MGLDLRVKLNSKYTRPLILLRPLFQPVSGKVDYLNMR